MRKMHDGHASSARGREPNRTTTTLAQLEERLEAVEDEIRQLKSLHETASESSSSPWWERLSGTFQDDPLFDKVLKAGQAYRRSLRPRRQ